MYKNNKAPNLKRKRTISLIDDDVVINKHNNRYTNDNTNVTK